MKQKAVFLAMALLATPCVIPTGAMAGMLVHTSAQGVSVQIGARNDRGYYWDGYDWRTPTWWRGHKGKHVGERNTRGEYWDGGRWSPKPPAGQGKTAKARQQPVAHKTTSRNTGADHNTHAQPNGDNGKQGQAQSGHESKSQENQHQGSGGEPIKPPQQ
ncbi:DUF2502 domain-containing protein [Sodalis sp. RH20]|uniref:DUF2502 domain-containing protein n=1 Tax=unclassified Sodalis (in: enterobacteria) TaxID=2636512 RepID=UPI0039B36AD5